MRKGAPEIPVVMGFQPFTRKEAEQADYVVCVNARKGPAYAAHIAAECAFCGTNIMHLPSAPVKPVKICFTCAIDAIGAGEPN